MWKQKIGISVWNMPGITTVELVRLAGQIGFDSVAPTWNTHDELAEVVTAARERDLDVGFLHAPFGTTEALWQEDAEQAAAMMQELMEALEGCKTHGIPVMVVHVWKTFDYTTVPNEIGFKNFDKLVETATAYGVKIAFENTEGEEFLAALMERYPDNDTVGFCWDSGHEMCYNHSQDLLAAYGDRLLVTHLNDNLGIRAFDGNTITWIDDLHLLPYDGIADWEVLVRRLKAARPLPCLNFELTMRSKPDRHENDLYLQMGPERFFTEAYKRACRIAWKYIN